MLGVLVEYQLPLLRGLARLFAARLAPARNALFAPLPTDKVVSIRAQREQPLTLQPPLRSSSKMIAHAAGNMALLAAAPCAALQQPPPAANAAARASAWLLAHGSPRPRAPQTSPEPPARTDCIRMARCSARAHLAPCRIFGNRRCKRGKRAHLCDEHLVSTLVHDANLGCYSGEHGPRAQTAAGDGGEELRARRRYGLLRAGVG